MLYQMFESVLRNDRAAVVLCDTAHQIVYMNPAAIKRYEAYGGKALVGRSLLDCHNGDSREKIERVLRWFSESRDNNMIFTSRNEKENKDVYMVALRDAAGALIGYYEKHEHRNCENAKMYDFEKSIL